MDNNDKKIALVTGGTGGIGTAICQRLAADGMRVIATYSRAEKKDQAEQWRAEQKELGFEMELVCVNVGDFSSCESAATDIASRVGDVDVIVNNAGITRDSVMKKMAVGQWDSVIETNLNSVFNITKQFLDGMISRQYGRVINISSINAQKGQFGQVNYSAAKAGMHGFTKALAQEVARKGITVNTISPGYIATSMIMAIEESVRDKIEAQIPIGRFGQPEEIARVVSFLAAEDAGFITGSNISANGGQHMF
ncbi:acetoacetyl-CoA reductase [Alkalimarinus sediminis]|uniref:Acetoacetyl-CoA reductase n=1 Tax=Alkalimarinus sediminis TaxID=1632866 RepID=A0A9E8KKY2_9ALTE|nr:acetoacetyl-CoA reductase [Alkalimarinus sediminis]UZW76686.1 acetoacetyl-CoA reductase [Alkalimarinus sediminis]